MKACASHKAATILPSLSFCVGHFLLYS